MGVINTRLLKLETMRADKSRELPTVVPDETSDAELARLRANGREVFRESDPSIYDLFV
jgi:hypothetical protein